VWTASATSVAPGRPVTLTWDNGAGLQFAIEITPDPDYLFQVRQSVRNTGTAPASLRPYARIRRDYTPQTAGFFILHEGFISVADGRLNEETYDGIKSEAARRRGPGWEQTATQGWVGFVDKYWMTALVPDQQTPVRLRYLHINEGGDRWQVDMSPVDAQVVPPGGTASTGTRVVAGAKEVHLLDRYRDGSPTSGGPIQDLDKAIDFGWFYFLTKPFFYALDWLYRLLGNFGLAIMAFTVIVKLVFFPLANKSYKAMSKMKLLAPKMQEIKERHGKDPQAMQREMMALYRTEKVNPASGCLPILIQIPVFFALYKVIFVTIEMRHAPFFGWIRDLSAPDPTNIFNLFGLLPWDLTGVPFLHLGAWPLFMGLTMWLQMKLNPQPPDPIQQKIFMFMPIIFTFMLATFPAGLVIYWSWNNLLSIAQQWVIMRQTRLEPKRIASAKT
jgi:YidC/Oxa1 family membrane protein insertase